MNIIEVVASIMVLTYAIYLVLTLFKIKIPTKAKACIEIVWMSFLMVYSSCTIASIIGREDISTGRRISGLILLSIIIVSFGVLITLKLKKLYKDYKLAKEALGKTIPIGSSDTETQVSNEDQVVMESFNTITVASPEDQADYDRAAKGEKK